MSDLLVTDVTVGDRPGRAVHVVGDRIAWLGPAVHAPSAVLATRARPTCRQLIVAGEPIGEPR